MTTTPHPPRETEVALIISSPRPEEVVERIAGLSMTAGYHLVPRDSLEIRDLYFDTRDHAFEPLRLALRIREIGPECWLALKGPSRKTDWGGVERLEIEESWSQDALAEVVIALADRGIDTPKQWRFSLGHPGEVLRDLGFQVIQDRETRRQVRNIVRADKEGGPVLAELVIDAVVYFLGDTAIRHYELEIESKTDTGVGVIAPVIDALTTLYDDVLRAWDHSKLAIGFALEEFQNKGDIEGLLDSSGNLKPAAYDKIDDYIRKRND